MTRTTRHRQTIRLALIGAAMAVGCGLGGAAGAEPAQADPASETGQADVGRVYANAVCAPCHAIEAGAKASPNLKAPPFSTFVTSARLTSAAIEGWLTASHANMPDLAVPADKRADLIAYIRSLALKP